MMCFHRLNEHFAAADFTVNCARLKGGGYANGKKNAVEFSGESYNPL